jgi:hypothetical protein
MDEKYLIFECKGAIGGTCRYVSENYKISTEYKQELEKVRKKLIGKLYYDDVRQKEDDNNSYNFEYEYYFLSNKAIQASDKGENDSLKYKVIESIDGYAVVSVNDTYYMNYDIKKWDRFDTRTTFNKFYQTEYSPLNSALKNTETLSEKFGKTLKLKALNLTNINLQTKKVIEKSMNSTDTENDDNLDEEQYFKTLVSNSGNNLLKLQYNNEENPKYNSRDKKFIEENKYITSKINKTKLFKEFPSKTREEFNVKKIVKYKNLKKNYKYEGNIKLKDKYENEEVTKDKLIVEDYLKTMWKRPLHKDAFKLHE